MNKESELECYLFYMWNAWSYDECVAIFEDYNHGDIWRVWEIFVKHSGINGAPSALYGYLTKTKRRKIVDRAISYYNQ